MRLKPIQHTNWDSNLLNKGVASKAPTKKSWHKRFLTKKLENKAINHAKGLQKKSLNIDFRNKAINHKDLRIKSLKKCTLE